MPKCFVCKCEIPLAEAVLISEGKRKVYCCPEHVQEGMATKGVQEDLWFILDHPNFALMYRTIWPVIQQAGVQKARYYLQETKERWIKYLAGKSFQDDFAKIRYFRKVLENNLINYKYVEPGHSEKQFDDGMSYETIVPKHKKRKTLNDILGGEQNGSGWVH